MSEGREALQKAGECVAASAYDSSITEYRRASRFFSTTSRRDLYYYSLVQIADVLIRQTRFAEADSLLQGLEVSVISELGENHRVTAGVYRLLGYLRTHQNRFVEALKYTKRGLAIWTEVAPDERVAQASYQYGVGIAYLRKGDGVSALEWLGQAEENQERYGSPSSSGVVQTLMAIGQAYELLGDLAGSIHVYERTLGLLDSLQMDQSPLAAAGRHLLAVALRQSGRFEESLAAERDALRISRAVYGTRHLAIASALAQMGDHCVLTGEYASATPYYNEALEIFKDLLPPEHSSIFEINRKLARLWLALGHADTAMHLYRAVIVAHESIFGPHHPSLAGLYSEAGEAFLDGGQTKEALHILERAYAVVPDKDTMMRAEVALQSGRALLALGRLQRSGVYLREARSLVESAEIANPELRSSTCQALGELLEKQGDPVGALMLYGEALEALSTDFQDTGNPRGLRDIPTPGLRRHYVASLIALARILAGTAPLPAGGVERTVKALNAYDHAAAVLARSRESYRSEGSKLAVQKSMQEICGEGFVLAVRLYRERRDPQYSDRAFSFAERMRASVLLEGMERAQRNRDLPMPGDPAANENALRLKADRLQRIIEWTTSFGDRRLIPSYRRELLMTYQSIDALDDSLRLSSPTRSGARASEHSVTIGELQSTLDPRSCFVEFARGCGGLYAVVVGRSDVAIVSLGDVARIDSCSIEMRRGLKMLDRDRYLSSARSLYIALMIPLKRHLRGIQHLIIVPDGGLSYVPFEALVVPQERGRQSIRSETDFRTPHYLVEDYEVSYALSGTLYHCTKSNNGASGGARTVFAGFAPVFRSTDVQVTKRQTEFLATIDPLATRSITVDGKTFSELPYSLTEVQDIARLFAAAGDTTLFLTESHATEESFKANAGISSILHVATHGFIDEEHPSLSALLFSPSSKGGSNDDGVLYAGEVYDLRLHADLVVLSSCESGVGKLVPGEGLMAMSRGFIYAGAKNIAYTLWKVNDRLTGRLMSRFYGHLLQGRSYAAALAYAKREMIARKESANPFFWAGFVLTGE